MPRRILLPTMLAAALPALAQVQDWLTIYGFPELEGSDVIQISPLPTIWQQQVTLDLRVTRQSTRNGYGQVPYRSFQALAAVDCSVRKGWYMNIRYFSQPGWVGEPVKVASFRPDEAPMAFRDIPGTPADRIINAACASVPAQAR